MGSKDWSLAVLLQALQGAKCGMTGELHWWKSLGVRVLSGERIQAPILTEKKKIKWLNILHRATQKTWGYENTDVR